MNCYAAMQLLSDVKNAAFGEFTAFGKLANTKFFIYINFVLVEYVP